jgi:hypothetical protein
MRGSKRSFKALIQENPEAQPERQPRWREIDAQLQQLARGLFEFFLEVARAVRDAYEEKVWEHFGYQDPERYFTERIGIKSRTLRRYLRIEEMLWRLPPVEHPPGSASSPTRWLCQRSTILPGIRARRSPCHQMSRGRYGSGATLRSVHLRLSWQRLSLTNRPTVPSPGPIAI